MSGHDAPSVADAGSPLAHSMPVPWLVADCICLSLLSAGWWTVTVPVGSALPSLTIDGFPQPFQMDRQCPTRSQGVAPFATGHAASLPVQRGAISAAF